MNLFVLLTGGADSTLVAGSGFISLYEGVGLPIATIVVLGTAIYLLWKYSEKKQNKLLTTITSNFTNQLADYKEENRTEKENLYKLVEIKDKKYETLLEKYIDKEEEDKNRLMEVVNNNSLTIKDNSTVMKDMASVLKDNSSIMKDFSAQISTLHLVLKKN